LTRARGCVLIPAFLSQNSKGQILMLSASQSATIQPPTFSPRTGSGPLCERNESIRRGLNYESSPTASAPPAKGAGAVCVLDSPIHCACHPPAYHACLDGRVRTTVYTDGGERLIRCGRGDHTCAKCGVTVRARKGGGK